MYHVRDAPLRSRGNFDIRLSRSDNLKYGRTYDIAKDLVLDHKTRSRRLTGSMSVDLFSGMLPPSPSNQLTS